MPAYSSIIAASALVSLVVAKPIPQAPATHVGFTVNQSVQKPFQPGPVKLAQAIAKFKGAVPADVAAAASGQGSVTTTPEQYDAEYLCPVTIGGQTLNLDFDTGSADLWVFSSELSSSQQSGHSIYNPSKSSTAKQLSGASWSISYGDGSGASGNVYTDTVTVGGVTVTKQAVEPAKSISAQFQQDTDNDGLLGLAFSSINTVTPTAQTTFFDTAISEGVLNQNVFTADLKKGEPGTYDFGFIDSNKYTGDITYTAVDTSQGFWEFTGTGYGVGSGNFQQTSIDAIADTGTTLILVDDDIVSAYYGEVDGASYDSSQGGYTFSCDATLPDFIVGIEDTQFTVPGSFINFAPADGNNCFGGIQSNSGIGLSIYGDVFLKSVFAVFDSDNTQVGFANKDL